MRVKGEGARVWSVGVWFRAREGRGCGVALSYARKKTKLAPLDPSACKGGHVSASRDISGQQAQSLMICVFL